MRARVRAAIRRTRSSSALRIATRRPAGAAPRPARPWRPRSRRASRSATGGRGWTAVTMPIRGRADRAPARGSRRRRTCPSRGPRASCSGPEPQHGQRQADLVVLVALGAQRREARARAPPRRPPWSRSWRCCPVMPTTSGSNRARQAAAIACERRAAGPARGRRSTSPSASGRLGAAPAAADEQRRRAAPRRRRRGSDGRRCARRQRDEQLARLDQPRVDGAAADRAIAGPQERAAGRGGRGPRRESAGAGRRDVDAAGVVASRRVTVTASAAAPSAGYAIGASSGRPRQVGRA